MRQPKLTDRTSAISKLKTNRNKKIKTTFGVGQKVEILQVRSTWWWYREKGLRKSRAAM
jgi:hypothetical protein